jgi:hypothetical protein
MASDFREDPHPRQPGVPDWHDNPIDWETAKLHVTQATAALKLSKDKPSTALRDNALHNLEQAVAALKGLTA